MIRLVCKFCGLVLADGLSECEKESRCQDDGKPLLPPRMFYISTGECQPEQVGDFIINLDDLTNTRPFLEMGGATQRLLR